MIKELQKQFMKLFGENGEIVTYFAPGRVNLIGEHTDYNGGHVFPCALTVGTYAVVRKNKTGKLRAFSTNFKQLGILECEVASLVYNKKDDWMNYPKSVIWALQQSGYKVEEGFDLLYCGTIPNQSGLSSSASIEILTCYLVADLLGYSIDLQEMALLSQKAENEFIGVNCGIMDQFAIAKGKKNATIFLDTRDLSYEYAPIVLEDVKIVIANTNKKRGLHDSKYNERRAECEKSLEELQTIRKIESLCELTEEEFEKSKHVISSELLQRRAKHAVYENQRTIKAVEALKQNDLNKFGQLMIESHKSLRDDYEVTGIELDTLVEEALKQKGTIGARMTGAGFGGCAVMLVVEDDVPTFIEKVGKAYQEKIGYAADFYVVEIGDGPHRING